MVREEARRTLLREYDKWAKDHPDDATKKGGVVFFTSAPRALPWILKASSVTKNDASIAPSCPQNRAAHRVASNERL
jgi:hypothetical protein